MRRVSVGGSIRLDQFLKWAGVASTGGQGKAIVLSGLVRVNGEVTRSRGKTLKEGDVVSVEEFGDLVVVMKAPPPGAGER